MNRLKISVGILFGILIGCAASVITPFVIAPVRAGSNPPRWETQCAGARAAQVTFLAIGAAHESKGWNPRLKAFGEQGGEPIQFAIKDGENITGVCFRRPL